MNGDIRKFRFWCQKVLPLVYDDSLSYYEVLCKLVQYLNKVIEDVNSIPDYIDAVITERLSDEHLRELIEQFLVNMEKAISSNNEGDNTNSSADYNVGQMLWWKGELYRVIRQIDAGDTIIAGTNIELVSFEDLFNDFVDEVKHDISANDDGASSTATQTWTAGTWVWLNDELYKVTSDITQGNAYVRSGDNANIEQITVEDEFHAEETARANADTALQAAIYDEATARANADTALQTAIDDEATTRANADDALQAEIDALILTQAVLAEDYGAEGDGVADDTAAIQSAIDNAHIVILDKTYRITDSLNVRDGVKIIGKGSIVIDGTFNALILNDNCSIIGITFTDTNSSFIDDYSVIYGDEVNNCTVVGCVFNSVHLGYCIRFDKSEHLDIKHNYINEYSYAGIMLVNGCYYADIEFNKIVNGRSSNANRYPISFSGYFTIADRSAKYIKCNYNEIIDDEPVWEAIDSHSSEFVEIIGNYISGTRYGIAFGSPSTPTLASGQSARNITIKDNIIFPIVGDDVAYGIMFTINGHGVGTIFNVDISNNRIVLTGIPTVYSDVVSAITLRSNANCVNIYNNDIEGAFNGVSLAASQFQNISINKNRFRSITGANIAAVNLHYEGANVINDCIDVSDNTMTNCTNDFRGPATVTRGLVVYNNNLDAQHYADIDYTTAPRSTAPSTATKAQGKTGDFIPCTETGTIAGWLCNSASHWVSIAGTII